MAYAERLGDSMSLLRLLLLRGRVSLMRLLVLRGRVSLMRLFVQAYPRAIGLVWRCQHFRCMKLGRCVRGFALPDLRLTLIFRCVDTQWLDVKGGRV
jgi:hypothetical protein